MLQAQKPNVFPNLLIGHCIGAGKKIGGVK
jgi:hypothetical protein